MLMLCLGAPLLLAFVQATDHPATPPPSAAPPPAAQPVQPVQPTAAAQPAPSVQPEDAPTPSDPKERLKLAEEVNGLHGFDMPWHLKASYEVFAPDGSSKDKGTYEEWRKDAKQYKIAFHSPAVSVEEYGTDHGIFRSGGKDLPRKPLSLIKEEIMQPVALEGNPEKVQLKNYERSFGKGKAPCTALVTRDGNETTETAASFCFAPQNAVVLYTSSPYRRFQALLEHIAFTNGHYLALDVQWFILGKPWLKLHIDTLDAFAPTDATVLTVPATALFVGPGANPLGKVTAGHTLNKVAPQYPSEAKQQGVQGEVTVSCTIGKDGHMKNLEVLAGPPMLQKAALDAVSQWVYQPYLLDGQPVEVETEVNVVFNLGR